MQDEALDTNDEAVDPNYDLDSSLKYDMDHIVEQFCDGVIPILLTFCIIVPTRLHNQNDNVSHQWAIFWACCCCQGHLGVSSVVHTQCIPKEAN